MEAVMSGLFKGWKASVHNGDFFGLKAAIKRLSKQPER